MLVHYPNRETALEFVNRLARKYLNDNNIVLKSSREVDAFKLTIQKVVDNKTDAFLYAPDADEEYDRRTRFLCMPLCVAGSFGRKNRSSKGSGF
jgi:hypothetical protein